MAKPKRNPTGKTTKKTKKLSPPEVAESPTSPPPITDQAIPKKSRFGRRSTTKTRPAKVPNVLIISKKSLSLLWRHKGVFLGIVAIYTALNIFLVRGLSGVVNLAPFKEIVTGGNLQQGIDLFAVLLQSSSNSSSSDAMGVIQACIFIVTSLAIIWTLRQVMIGERVRVRDGFYRGMYPLVPVILVIVVILLEFLPLIIGSFIYSLIISNGIATNFVELIPWGILYFIGLLTTLYLLTTSIIAAYIVTLPDMTPLKALRSAKELVIYRRWSVLRKLVFLPFALVILTIAIMLPLLLWLTPLAPWVFFGMSMLSIAVVHAYIYTLYRELLA